MTEERHELTDEDPVAAGLPDIETEQDWPKDDAVPTERAETGPGETAARRETTDRKAGSDYETR